jgi:U4/U6.U5 tri-snRNP component SNU23
MSNNLNYKQVANVSRRTWDAETYEKKAKARQEEAEDPETARKRKTDEFAAKHPDQDEEKEEFTAAEGGAAGPEGSKRAFLKPRQAKVDIDSKVGTTEMVSAEEVATTSTEDGSVVVKTGVGWHCKVCDCFLKDSLTYLDHINGRKHQRKLGYTMRVERSTKDQLMDRLKRLADEKSKEEDKDDSFLEEEMDYDDIVKAKDEALQLQREEKRKKRKERKQQLAEQEPQEEEGEDEDVHPAGIDPAMAAMMGFAGFGGSGKNR